MRASRTRLLLLSILALLGPTRDGPAQTGPTQTGRPRATSPSQLRQRWQKLDPKKRERIEELFDRLKGLPPQQRRAFLERLRRLQPDERRRVLDQAQKRAQLPTEERHQRRLQRELLRRQWSKLRPEQRQKLRSLSPQQRSAYILKLVKPRRERLIQRLPAPYRERVTRLPQQQQVRFLRLFRAYEATKNTFRDPAEVRRLRRRVPRREITRRLLARDQRAVEASPADGPRAKGKLPQAKPTIKPPFLSAATWARWRKLEPYERPRVVRYLLTGPQSPDGKILPPRPPRANPRGNARKETASRRSENGRSENGRSENGRSETRRSETLRSRDRGDTRQK